MERTGQEECLLVMKAAPGSIERCTKQDLRINPNLYRRMTNYHCSIATSQQRADALRQRTNLSPKKSETAGLSFWKNFGS